MTFRSLSAIITYVARRERLSKTSPTCGRSSSGRAPPCQGGGSEFEPRRPLHMGKFSSAGRASALQAEGQRFEPVNFHQCGPVVQLVRTLACHARGRQFEPDSGRHYASVAQSVEQGTENPRVIGSIPIGGTIFLCILRKEYTFLCGRSSSGRAPPCQGGGSEFEPRRPLQTNSGNRLQKPVFHSLW